MNSPMTNADPAANGQVVVFPPERGIGVLAVAPPYPPGYKLQSDGALGININMVHSDRDGLLVYILAYESMAIGDYIRVYIETKNAPVAEFSVTEAHFDANGNAKNIPFYIASNVMESRFLPFQANNLPLWFDVTRVSGNGTEGSPPVPLFYKYPAPGEADTDGGKPFNQGLKLPVASESIIDQTVIDEGMFVTVLAYFNQSIGDVVVLAFGTLLLEHTVTVLGDIVFELTPQMLASLMPTNSLVVRWEVIDRVQNTSGWSDALMLTAKPGTVLLIAPIFEQADPDNVVNHDLLLGGTLGLLVTGLFAANDLIKLVLTGLTKGGDTTIQTFSQTLPASRSVKFEVPNEWVRNLIGGSARASYDLISAGNTRGSKPADATFSGSSLPLGLPIVDPLVDNKLPVDTATATVQVAKYWPLKIGAIVNLNWQTTDQDGIKALFIFKLIVTDPTQPVIFHVPAKYIAPYANTPLTVQCTVTNPGEVEVFSNLLQLMFGEEVIGTPLPPRVDEAEADGKNLVPFKARNTLTIVVPTNPAFKPDARLTVSWIAAAGTPSGGSYTSAATLVSAGLIIRIPNSVVAFCLGTVVRVFYTIVQDGKTYVSGDLNLSVQLIPQESSDLPTPTIAGVMTKELDASKLAGNEKFSVAQWFLQAYGQGVWLRYDGFLPNGNATEYVLWTGQAHKYPPSALITQAPIAWLKTLADQSVMTVRFGVNFNGVADKTRMVGFPRREYTIRAALTLLAPTVKEASNGKTLEPFAAQYTLTCQVPANTFVDGDQITVSWIAPTGTSPEGSYTSPATLVSAGLAISIPISVVAHCLGLTVTVIYNVIRRGVSSPSKPLSLMVLAIADFDSRLPAPTILQAENSGVGPELDVTNLTGPATIRCLVWPLIALFQPVWLILSGKNASGEDIATTLLSFPKNAVHQVWINQGRFDLTIPESFYRQLADGSILEAKFLVAFDKSADINKAITFTLRRYTIRALKPILSEDFDHRPTQLIAPGGQIVLDSMTITFRAGNGYMGITPLANVITGPYPQIPDQCYRQVLEMHWQASGTTQHMHIQFNWSYSFVSFYCRFAQFNNLSVIYRDEQGNLLHHMNLPNNFNPQLITYSTAGHNYIWSIEIITPVMDLIVFDYFKMRRV
ncbi:hypothetical protein [Pseudomonas sp. DR48]|uniref:hypothetical protein n=1 Tax=Pseudomonas sp. DR48 TaxID=2871095 RepID=UPI001C98EFAF|nr:hypothetical protein [Pseudomonas sp. DR48]QZP29816.1 hypothetical protein K5K95_16390 [Pseudomonas sp. DR48]